MCIRQHSSCQQSSIDAATRSTNMGAAFGKCVSNDVTQCWDPRDPLAVYVVYR